ncbi:MAG: hypothetical protein Kow0037_27160 [Calditrichia bacterium]
MKYIIKYLIIHIILILSCSDKQSDVTPNTKKLSSELKLLRTFVIQEETYKIADIAGLHNPHHVDNEENLYLLDLKNRYYVKYNSKGEFIGFIGGKGKGPGEYIEPSKLTTDNKRYIYLFDISKNATIVYYPDNTFFEEYQYGNYIPAPGNLKITDRYKIISLFSFKTGNYYEKVSLFHFLDDNFSVLKSINVSYPKEYKRFDLKNFIWPLWDSDSSYLYVNFTALPFIYRYDFEGNLEEILNINANHFKIVQNKIPQTPDIIKTAKYLAKSSNSFSLYLFKNKYIFYSYFNMQLPSTNNLNIWDLDKYRKYYYNIISVGNQKAQTPESKFLPGKPLFCNTNGALYLLLNDEPDKREIGVYNIVVEEN